MQDIMIAETMSALSPDPGLRGRSDPPRVFEICAHTPDLTDLIISIVNTLQGGSSSLNCTCEVCDTDAVVEIVPFDSKVALIITRWVNLGLGLTQNDILWRNHVYSSPGYKSPLPDHLVTNPRFCFEDKASESFEELRSRNLSYLRDDRYKLVMSSASKAYRASDGTTQWAPATWFMRDKEQPPKKRGRFMQYLLDRLVHE
ncbi:hypothetical protein N7466_006411 [Penicillium verhagenii]|uniref:uncharacterized protein n=1 Tax=Penicillium verhagenii TaxID=1562060 RepID=UPI002545653C|nr:uncharacterized protein N7466_006411 [Penicillium verhagenii]KAJ5930918.1 hypothetical protein N7466_006411 [Penicillium verhagenii]